MPPSKSSSEIARAKPSPYVRQFSVFLENKCGRLLFLTRLFEQSNVHVLGLSVVDTTDSAVVRLVVDDPDRTVELFNQHGIPYSDTDLVVVRLSKGPTDMTAMLTALLQAEINIFYIYSLMIRPSDSPLLAFYVEDSDLAAEVLHRNGFSTLNQGDLSR